MGAARTESGGSVAREQRSRRRRENRYKGIVALEVVFFVRAGVSLEGLMRGEIGGVMKHIRCMMKC